MFSQVESPPASAHDMVEVELGAPEAPPTVLAGIAVAGEDVKTRKAHMAARHPRS